MPAKSVAADFFKCEESLYWHSVQQLATCFTSILTSVNIRVQKFSSFLNLFRFIVIRSVVSCYSGGLSCNSSSLLYCIECIVNELKLIDYTLKLTFHRFSHLFSFTELIFLTL